MNERADYQNIIAYISECAQTLGFDAVGISHTDLGEHETRLMSWLGKGLHGDMSWMGRYGNKRSRPHELRPGTVSIISVRMLYSPSQAAAAETALADHTDAYIARYALGRDYHKLMRMRLQRLAKRLQQKVGPFGYRAFADSAPVMEKAIAERAGLGWIGKHTLLIHRDVGSWFFLGELFTDLPLPASKPTQNQCGQCQRCMEVCPTGAIVAPYLLDARRCIAYLTIELKDSIPVELRPLIGNRVFGCDDCQIFCPWNRFAKTTENPDFAPRNRLDRATLIELFSWSRAEFKRRTEGSVIRRLGYERWLRNIAVGLGNAMRDTTGGNEAILAALRARAAHPSALVREHVAWALGVAAPL